MIRILFITLLLVGCSTPSTPRPDIPKVKAPDDRQLRFYKPPEEIWPDDFKPAPQVCGSPFQGKLISR